MEADVTLMELLEGLEDPRRPQGKRHPLPALLGLAVVAMLAGMTSYEAIVQYGKERGWEFLKHLGFTTRWGLCKATCTGCGTGPSAKTPAGSEKDRPRR